METSAVDRRLCQEVWEQAQSRRDDLARLLAELIRIPSPSCQEQRVAARIQEAMGEAGFEQIRIDGLGSVIGRIGSGPHSIAMDAHIDTVEMGNRADWTFGPFEGRIADGRVWGRGAADQKGGMAALIVAGAIIKEMGLAEDCTLHVTGTVMEEDCDGLCWQYLIREEGLRPEVCVITEPTACRVYRGQRGRMEIEIEVRGRSAHASAPERGKNAIYRMAELVKGIERLAPQLPADAFLGKGSIAVTHFLGQGPSLCAIPDVARAHLDRRLTWGETRDSVMEGIRSMLGQFPWAAEPDAVQMRVKRYERAAYTGTIYPTEAVFPAWTVASDHRAVRAARTTFQTLASVSDSFSVPDSAAASDSHDPGEGERWVFSTNGVAICGLHGIPCIGFGPGYEAQAHAPDEFCPIDHLVKAAAFYACFPHAYAQTESQASGRLE